MSQIQIYARVRPTSRQFSGIKVPSQDNTLAIHIGDQDNITKRPESRYARAPPSKHMFKFRHIFDQQASQEEVFNRVATHMIDSFLTGYVVCCAEFFPGAIIIWGMSLKLCHALVHYKDTQKLTAKISVWLNKILRPHPLLHSESN